MKSFILLIAVLFAPISVFAESLYLKNSSNILNSVDMATYDSTTICWPIWVGENNTSAINSNLGSIGDLTKFNRYGVDYLYSSSPWIGGILNGDTLVSDGSNYGGS